MRFWRRGRESGGDPPADAPFPEFAYHAGPRSTGVVVESDARCRACGIARGYIYTGPVYAADELDDALCPWCIADGSAAKKFDAEFTDAGVGVPDDVPGEIVETIARRTPGFSAWQEERWLYHCGDGAVFLGAVGRDELEEYPEALDALRQERVESGRPADEVEEYIAALETDGDATAYLFRCRHCGRHLAYSDFA